jgi:hypothetical protein
MLTMAEYINRESAISLIKQYGHDAIDGGRYSLDTVDDCIELANRIKALPTADVEPVVRCKDCKYRDGTPGQPNILCAQMHEDDFCSYGERKEEPHDRLQKDL